MILIALLIVMMIPILILIFIVKFNILITNDRMRMSKLDHDHVVHYYVY